MLVKSKRFLHCNLQSPKARDREERQRTQRDRAKMGRKQNTYHMGGKAENYEVFGCGVVRESGVSRESLLLWFVRMQLFSHEWIWNGIWNERILNGIWNGRISEWNLGTEEELGMEFWVELLFCSLIILFLHVDESSFFSIHVYPPQQLMGVKWKLWEGSRYKYGIITRYSTDVQWGRDMSILIWSLEAQYEPVTDLWSALSNMSLAHWVQRSRGRGVI